MTSVWKSDVLIIGAGLAGLSAAVALSGVGANVTLLERKPYVGGRAYSYPHPALDEVIDSQHVMLGCCTNLIDLCRLAGADKHIRWYDRISFLEPGGDGKDVRQSDIGASWLPAPGHSSLSFLNSKMLSLVDKVGIARGLLEFMRGYPRSDAEPFSAWLKRTAQSDRAIRHFWEPVIVGALNDDSDRCSTRYAGQVFYESFLKSAEGGRLGIPTQPLSDFYTSLAELAGKQGTQLHLRCSIERVERRADGWVAIAQDGAEFFAEKVLLALPFEQAAKPLATIPEPAETVRHLLRNLDNFSHAPITTVHLWFDREVTQLDHAALLDTRIQWVFNKTRIRRDEPEAPHGPGQYLELVISASFPELKMSREEILQPALEELSRFFPEVKRANVVKSGILKEARATFSVVPGLDAYRPSPNFLGDDLYLAGDWTQTGWPSTMEGAVRSGRLAAEAMHPARSESERFLTADLVATGLTRLIATERI